MNAEEVRADQTGSNQLPCNERHYVRFLTRILPGPESTFGAYRCAACGQYFDQDGKQAPSPLKGFHPPLR